MRVLALIDHLDHMGLLMIGLFAPLKDGFHPVLKIHKQGQAPDDGSEAQVVGRNAT